jgi:hypothetical protein
VTSLATTGGHMPDPTASLTDEEITTTWRSGRAGAPMAWAAADDPGDDADDTGDDGGSDTTDPPDPGDSGDTGDDA